MANCRDGVRGAAMLHGADPECANAGNAEPFWPSAFACNDCDAMRETTRQLPLGPTGVWGPTQTQLVPNPMATTTMTMTMTTTTTVLRCPRDRPGHSALITHITILLARPT